ncbi:MAG: peroxiredoxin family protein [Chloroflexi bacterium]|nr:peroxiredoxin family protein [Chloroflexota bacterium]MBU1748154.1 peroxiredoxin family protein [Chloroflexota bacterium]
MPVRWLAIFAVLLFALCGCALLDSGPLPVGSTAPELRLPSTGGSTISLADYRGRPVLLNFWSTT